ncbi:MAG: hypothetical protein ACYCY7_05605 [Gallionella sp.]
MQQGFLAASEARQKHSQSGNPEHVVIARRRSQSGNPEHVVIARRRSRRGNPDGLKKMHFCLAGLLHFVRNDGFLKHGTPFAMTTL